MKKLIWDLPVWVHNVIVLTTWFRIVRTKDDGKPNTYRWHFGKWPADPIE